MADELVTGLLKDSDLRVLVATTSDLSQKARQLHSLAPTSAALLAQGLTGGLLYAALQKSAARINLQLECDGPLRGLFVDAESDGSARGYVKNPLVAIESAGEFRWRPALGNKGFLSVLRDVGNGEFFRSSVELEFLDVALDLERYFKVSDQLQTFVALEAVATADDSLGAVAGIFLQPLPSGDLEVFNRLSDRLRDESALKKALKAGNRSAAALTTALVASGDLEILSRIPLSFRCTCSIERVRRAVRVMGQEELEDILRKERRAEATCQFCSTRYVVEEAELRQMLEKMVAAGVER